MREHRRVKQQDAVNLLGVDTVARFGGVKPSRDAHRTCHCHSRLLSLPATDVLGAKTRNAIARETCNKAIDGSSC
jgi:hypothetical protein